MITASDLTGETSRDLARKKHREAMLAAVDVFVPLLSGYLSYLTAEERKGCRDAIRADPERALACYRSISSSLIGR